MRYSAIILLCCAACGDPKTPNSPSEDPAHYLPVSGTVYDSVLGQAIPGLRVLVGDSAVLTDTFGRFSTMHRSGAFVIAVNDSRYETFTRPDRLQGNNIVVLSLRGRAPYVTSCEFGADSVMATMVDLQGRKTINRRNGSFLTAELPGDSLQNDAYSWSWRPIDDFTWRTASPVSSSASAVEWRLEDADGNSRTTRCVRSAPPPPCETCGGNQP
jgi:hypothetical protein